MQYITNTSKGGVRFVAQNLVPVYGEVVPKYRKIIGKECLVTHYDRDLIKAMLWSMFGYAVGIKLHISHVDPINLFKRKYVARSVLNIFIYKLASTLGWRFVFISRENYAKYRGFISAEYIANPLLSDLEIKASSSLSVKDSIRFVNMGRFDFQKNQKQTLEFIEYLEKKYPGNCYEFHFYGDGPLLPLFIEEISIREYKDKIFLHDWSDDVYEDLRKYHIYLQSSIWEGLPTIVIQAISQGLKILSFPIVSSASLLNDSSYIDKYFTFEYFLENSEAKIDLIKYSVDTSLEEHKKLYEKLRVLHLR